MITGAAIIEAADKSEPIISILMLGVIIWILKKQMRLIEKLKGE